jgi:hypothetical protein
MSSTRSSYKSEERPGSLTPANLTPVANPHSTTHYFHLLPEPKVPHRVLQEHETRERLIIVGDVHGCYHELLEILEKCNFNAENTQVIIVGDLVNKGPHSDEVIKFVRKQKNILCVRGNHDQAALVYALNLDPDPRPASYNYLDGLDRLVSCCVVASFLFLSNCMLFPFLFFSFLL